MKKTLFSALSLLLVLLLAGCGGKQSAAPAAEEETNVGGEAAVSEETIVTEAPATETADTAAQSDDETAGLTEEQALAAVRAYCYIANPELEGIVQAGEYPVGWEIASADGDTIVVLFRSYTGAELSYAIDRSTGDTSVTEYVSGVMEEPQPTEETFNVFDYLTDDSAATAELSTLDGVWKTVSMGYEGEGGELSAEYDVEFTSWQIRYGHWTDGQLALDHADPISLLEEIAPGRFRVQAESDSGVRYTYQTSEEDGNLMEYYETWDEAEFPETYSGGASLFRAD